MKNNVLCVIGLLLAVLLLIGCSSTKPSTEPSSGNSITGAVIGVPEEKPVEVVPEVTIEEKKEEVILYNPKIKELKDKSAQIDNYYYHFQSVVIGSNGISVENNAYSLMVRGLQSKKIYLQPKNWKEDIYYNEVYLDSNQKVAYVACADTGVLCKPSWEKAYGFSYDSESVSITPKKIMDDLNPHDYKVLGFTLVDDRRAVILETTTLEGNKEKLFVDDYYGLPLRQVIFKLNEDDEEIILVNRNFILVGAGSGTVKISDVTVPGDFEVVE